MAGGCRSGSGSTGPGGAQVGNFENDFVLFLGGLLRPEATHFKASFGILVKNYTIWTPNHRNRIYLEPFRGHFSILGRAGPFPTSPKV